MKEVYADVARFVHSLVPTWRKTQQRNLVELMLALDERPQLCLSELARALPESQQPLHGRLKRLTRFLDNPRLDEGALFARWLRLTYHFLSQVTAPTPDREAQAARLIPILLDTVYFEPFAVLLATAPCGSRGLPIALLSYHRYSLERCILAPEQWPGPTLMGQLPPRRGMSPSECIVSQPLASQNQIEQELIDLVWQMLCPRLRGVLVADRGFARASLFEQLRSSNRAFVIRIDRTTHIYQHPDQPSQTVEQACALRPGERCGREGVWYHQQQCVPVNLLALWEPGQKEPWYLVTTLDEPAWAEECYRWRMRTECTHRDQKSGLLLRQGGDEHRLRSLRHLHRLVVTLACLEWWHALVGLQAWHDLPQGSAAPRASEAGAPPGPALPPPVRPHRGASPLPPWMRRFAVWGSLSYVRLGFEVVRASDLRWLIHRMLVWLFQFLEPYQPLWRPWQRRYRHHLYSLPPP